MTATVQWTIHNVFSFGQSKFTMSDSMQTSVSFFCKVDLRYCHNDVTMSDLVSGWGTRRAEMQPTMYSVYVLSAPFGRLITCFPPSPIQFRRADYGNFCNHWGNARVRVGYGFVIIGKTIGIFICVVAASLRSEVLVQWVLVKPSSCLQKKPVAVWRRH